ncbi:uncharacterized protein TNCV_2738231 [Trichonephila clavipes]|nr:uncharacterized protein TNCV_2738231 [Trichonephila clavipes]
MPVLVVTLRTMQVTVRFWFVSTPILEANTPGVIRSLPPTSREDLQLDGYLEYPHVTKALYIYKHPCLLRDSDPGSTAQQSVSL